MSLPATKFMSLDNDAREYLLYCLIMTTYQLGGQLIIPDFIQKKELSREDFKLHGEALAARKPARYGLGKLPDPPSTTQKGTKKQRAQQ